MTHSLIDRLSPARRIAATILLSGMTTGLSAALANEPTYWTDEGNYDISWFSEDTDSYEISTASQLAGLAYLVNAAGENFKGATINLTHDISLNDHLWLPIGNGRILEQVSDTGEYLTATFNGNFNGNGHDISGMHIDCDALSPDSNNTYYAGLFGKAEYGYLGGYNKTTLSNLKIIDSRILMNGATHGWQNINLGFFVGAVSYNVAVSDIYVEGIVEFSPTYLFTTVCAGGITGSGSPEKCSFNGKLSVKTDRESRIGGITGSGSAVDCTNKGDIIFNGVFGSIGGIVGDGSADGCINRGNIQIFGEGSSELSYGFCVYTGGIAGNGSACNSGNLGKITSNLYSPEIGSNTTFIGAIAPNSDNINCYNLAPISSKTHNAGIEEITGISRNIFGDNDLLLNSYSCPAIVSSDHQAQYIFDVEDFFSKEYICSKDFLSRLNENAIEICKYQQIVQNWISDDNGFPILSGKRLYPLALENGYEISYGSVTVENMWDKTVYGNVTVNGECFHAGDKVTVNSKPADGYFLESATLTYTDSTNEPTYIHFENEDISDNGFSFEMPPYASTLSFVFTNSSGIDDITIDSSENVSIYSTDGKMVYNGLFSTAKLSPGLYIIKSGGKSKKIIVR